MFDTIREYFESRREMADAMRGYARTMRQSDRKMDRRARADHHTISRFSASLDNLSQIAVAWIKTPSTRPTSTVAFDLFAANLLRGVAAGSEDVASYLSEKAERAREKEARFTEDQHVGVELARIVGDALMREGQGYEIVISNPAVASKAAAVIRKQLLQDTSIVLREDGQSLLKVTAGVESSNCDKRQGSRIAEIIGAIHMAEGKLCSFLVKPEEAHAISVLIQKYCSRQIVIEDGDVPGKSHIIVRAVDEAVGGESVH
jgi:hypothetical protein